MLFEAASAFIFRYGKAADFMVVRRNILQRSSGVKRQRMQRNKGNQVVANFVVNNLLSLQNMAAFIKKTVPPVWQ
jgi:hypothetical protein